MKVALQLEWTKLIAICGTITKLSYKDYYRDYCFKKAPEDCGWFKTQSWNNTYTHALHCTCMHRPHSNTNAPPHMCTQAHTGTRFSLHFTVLFLRLLPVSILLYSKSSYFKPQRYNRPRSGSPPDSEWSTFMQRSPAATISSFCFQGGRGKEGLACGIGGSSGLNHTQIALLRYWQKSLICACLSLTWNLSHQIHGKLLHTVIQFRWCLVRLMKKTVLIKQEHIHFYQTRLLCFIFVQEDESYQWFYLFI